jgi:hypothetical protein
MGVLHHQLGRALTAEQAEKLGRAVAELDRAEELYSAAGETAGMIETRIAKADAVRFLGGAERAHEAVDLYAAAWNLLVQDNAQEALGQERYDAMLAHVQSCMHALGALQFGKSRGFEEDGNRPLAELEQKGLVRRVRPRGTGGR